MTKKAKKKKNDGGNASKTKKPPVSEAKRKRKKEGKAGKKKPVKSPPEDANLAPLPSHLNVWRLYAEPTDGFRPKQGDALRRALVEFSLSCLMVRFLAAGTSPLGIHDALDELGAALAEARGNR